MKYQLLIILSALLISSYSHADSQRLAFKTGTNLVTFTLSPDNPDPAVVFGALGDAFISAHYFDNQSKKFLVYTNPIYTDIANLNVINANKMGPIVAGMGFFINMKKSKAITITGTQPISNQVTLYPGYNLVGLFSSESPGPFFMGDVLNGKNYTFPSVVHSNGLHYSAYHNNDPNIDNIYFTPGEALWIHLEQNVSKTIIPEFRIIDPLVYFYGSDAETPLIVEAPIADFYNTISVPIPIKLSRSYTGSIGFFATGTAIPELDYSLLGVSSKTIADVIHVDTQVSQIYNLPLVFKSKQGIQSNKDLFITLKRPSDKFSDSATRPQVRHITITHGLNGIYDAYFVPSKQVSQANIASTLNGQNFTIALRSDGQAIFEPASGGLFSRIFALPYTIDPDSKMPSFQGRTTISLDTEDILSKTIQATITPVTTNYDGSTKTVHLQLVITFLNLKQKQITLNAEMNLILASAPLVSKDDL